MNNLFNLFSQIYINHQNFQQIILHFINFSNFNLTKNSNILQRMKQHLI